MTEPQLLPSSVECLDVRHVELTEVCAPVVPAEHQLARDQVWDEAVRANPGALFDGLVVACVEVERGEAGALAVSWAPVTYRHFALRRVPGAVALPSMFVSVVQPTTEGGLLVGRMSAATAAPARWQMPGGSVEPPAGERLDVAELGRQAARELVEETGIETRPESLSLWAVTRGEHGNVGVFFLAPALRESQLRARFTEVVGEETAAGRAPELEAVAIIGSPADLAALPGPHVDYLATIVGRYSSRQHSDLF